MDITEYLYNSGFYIEIKEIEGNEALSVTLPETKIFENKYPKTVFTYLFTDTGLDIYNGYVTKSIECEDYTKRLVVWAHLLCNATERDFNPEIILVFRKDGSKYAGSEFLELLKGPENKKREARLASVFLLHLSNPSLALEKAKDFGVTQSFKLLQQVLLGEV